MSSNGGIDNLRVLEQQFDKERAAVVDLRSLEDIRARYLSRKSGLLTLQLQSLGKLPASDRAEFGRVANLLKTRIESALDELERTLAGREKNATLLREAIDVTLPGNRRRVGHRHPLTIVRKEIEYIFVAMAIPLRKGRRSKAPTTISMRSIRHLHIRRGIHAIRSTLPTKSFCEPILHPCRFARWKR